MNTSILLGPDETAQGVLVNFPSIRFQSVHVEFKYLLCHRALSEPLVKISMWSGPEEHADMPEVH